MKKFQIKNHTEEYSIGKIICVGKNYLEHAKELGDDIPEKPVLFMKPASALISSGENIVYPSFTTSLHYETELVLLIGRDGKEINRQSAFDYIAGYSVGLDMTLRDIQNEAKKKGHPWTISKCFDTSAVIGEFGKPDSIDMLNNLSIRLEVNGITRQDDNTSNMIFNVAEIIEYVSGYFKLEQGDLIFTGTPKGVGEVKKGDSLKAFISPDLTLSTRIS